MCFVEFVDFYHIMKLLRLVKLFYSIMLYQPIKYILNTGRGPSPFLVSSILSSGVSRQDQKGRV